MRITYFYAFKLDCKFRTSLNNTQFVFVSIYFFSLLTLYLLCPMLRAECAIFSVLCSMLNACHRREFSMPFYQFRNVVCEFLTFGLQLFIITLTVKNANFIRSFSALHHIRNHAPSFWLDWIAFCIPCTNNKRLITSYVSKLFYL